MEIARTGDEIVFQTPVHHIFIFPGARRGERPSVGGGPTRVGGRHLSDGPRGAGAQVGPRTRALLLCNPHSPVGRAWSREELEQLSQSCTARHPRDSRRGLRGAPPPAPCTPFATVSPAASRNTITVTSASKSFNLTGLKHSLVICENPALREAYDGGQRKSNTYYGGSTMGIVATEAAMTHGDLGSSN
jgi:cystathionine beta-lyase